MNLAERDQPNSEIDEQLQRILTDPGFQSAPQLSKLLTYLVERALVGQADDFKATAIAKAVFRRDDSFDAQTDTIVRVEAGRLRRRLAKYYEGDGLNDPLVIDIPKGGYTPRFSEPATPAPESGAVPESGPAPQTTGHAESGAITTPAAPARQPARKWAALLTLGLFICFL